MLFCHLVCGNLQLVIGNRPLVFGNKQLVFCISYFHIDSSQPTGKRPYLCNLQKSLEYLDILEFLERLDYLDRLECLDRLYFQYHKCLDRLEFLDRLECLDSKYQICMIYKLWRVIGWVGVWCILTIVNW